MKSFIAPGITALWLATAVAADPGGPKTPGKSPPKAAIPTAAQVTKDFKTYTKMTPKEVHVDPFFSDLCRGVPKETVENA